jgi:hypothetical protein
MAIEYVEISSNYTRKKPKVLTIEDVAKKKRTRNHKKRHSVNKEKAFFDKRKKDDLNRYLAKRDKIMRDFKKLARAYWANEIQNHPDRPKLPIKPRYDLPAKTRTSYK